MTSNEGGPSKPVENDGGSDPGEPAGKAAVKGGTPGSGEAETAPAKDQEAIDLDLAHDRAS